MDKHCRLHSFTSYFCYCILSKFLFNYKCPRLNVHVFNGPSDEIHFETHDVENY